MKHFSLIKIFLIALAILLLSVIISLWGWQVKLINRQKSDYYRATAGQLQKFDVRLELEDLEYLSFPTPEN